MCVYIYIYIYMYIHIVCIYVRPSADSARQHLTILRGSEQVIARTNGCEKVTTAFETFCIGSTETKRVCFGSPFAVPLSGPVRLILVCFVRRRRPASKAKPERETLLPPLLVQPAACMMPWHAGMVRQAGQLFSKPTSFKQLKQVQTMCKQFQTNLSISYQTISNQVSKTKFQTCYNKFQTVSNNYQAVFGLFSSISFWNFGPQRYHARHVFVVCASSL